MTRTVRGTRARAGAVDGAAGIVSAAVDGAGPWPAAHRPPTSVLRARDVAAARGCAVHTAVARRVAEALHLAGEHRRAVDHSRARVSRGASEDAHVALAAAAGAGARLAAHGALAAARACAVAPRAAVSGLLPAAPVGASGAGTASAVADDRAIGHAHVARRVAGVPSQAFTCCAAGLACHDLVEARALAPGAEQRRGAKRHGGGAQPAAAPNVRPRQRAAPRDAVRAACVCVVGNPGSSPSRALRGHRVAHSLLSVSIPGLLGGGRVGCQN